jgi:hypothetical protein
MIQQFFRQAWTMMKQHRLFTSMYLIGTAVSIALAMTLFIIFYIKLGPIYPEYNRQRMLVIEKATWELRQDGGVSKRQTAISTKFADLLKREAKSLEHIALLGWKKIFISTEDGNVSIEEFGHETNSDFWKVFNFKFIDGRPYTAEEANEQLVVISRSWAYKFFTTDKAAGKILKIGRANYRVVGVVEDTSGCSSITAGDYWIPLCINPENEQNIIGSFHAYMTSDNTEELKKEMEDIFGRCAQMQPKEYSYTMEVKDFWQKALDCEKDESPFDAIGKYLYILLAYLFIPALNLSGLIPSRMDSRMEEIGVRKAYGATNGEIIVQVLLENLLLTLVGAVMGLALSYIIVYTCDSWITTLFEANTYIPFERSTDVSMLLNPTVLGTTVAITALLNISSALVPTLLALRNSIVEALYYRR